VAEYIVGTMLALLRGTYEATEAVVAGTWPRLALIGREARGRLLGLVGLDEAAREVAKRAAAFGIAVQFFDFARHSTKVSGAERRTELAALLATSDVVSIHLPHTEATHHLLNRAAIDLLKPDAIVICASQAGVVDQLALVDAVFEGRIGGAAIDVFEEEPVSPRAGRAFAGVRNLILTPHVAGLTVESNARISWMVARRVGEALAGPAAIAAE
jgi:(S)-sulfolactate dehydrogenase